MTKKSNVSRAAPANDHPFGSDTKRFRTLGLHPQLTTVGKSDLGPGQYDAKEHECAYKQNLNNSSWARKLQTEEFSKFLGYRNAEILQYRQYRQTCVGPGWTNVPDDELDRGTKFGNEKRFNTFIKDDQPPPGTYVLKSPRTKFGDLPTFEWDGLQKRFKDAAPAFQQAPNRYDQHMKHITDKKVSKRGPYDTFTGPRDGTTIKNHFAPPSFLPPDKYYDVPGDLDYMLTHKSKRGYGVLSKAVRFPPNKRILVTRNFSSFLRESDFPGPDRYDIKAELPDEYEWTQNKHHFNSSNKNARPPFRHTIHPGPERYRPRKPRCGQAPTLSWMFKSKTDRKFYRFDKFNDFGLS